MASSSCIHITSFLSIALLIALLFDIPHGVQSIGVCYGRNGDNLPSPGDVVKLYQSNGINGMRLYSPDEDALQALRGSNIPLILDVPNTDLQAVASGPSSAATWVQNNIQPYSADVNFRYIAVGNEVIPGGSAQYVLPAMQNIYNALSGAGLGNIKVSTAVNSAVVSGYPPHAGTFSAPEMQPIVQFLVQNNLPLLANIYPYFSYTGNEAQISLDYALFTSSGTVVTDNQYNYQNLFDALVDTMYAALEQAGGSNVPIVVSESGWPSAGGDAATVQNAQTYNQNLINHVGKGTPRRPGAAIETYIFAMFDEDQKPGAETERHFGLFSPNQQPKYQINFS